MRDLMITKVKLFMFDHWNARPIASIPHLYRSEFFTQEFWLRVVDRSWILGLTIDSVKCVSRGQVSARVCPPQWAYGERIVVANSNKLANKQFGNSVEAALSFMPERSP